ncbi:MAG: hypothetical protein PHC84_01860 [Clostridia bacterium]|nr:hypothetical protein [Clostridia bacterium]
MKLFSRLLAPLLLIVLCVSLFACKKEPYPPNDLLTEYYWKEMPVNTNPNLKYFGYYHFSDAIDEVVAMGNANLGKVDAEDIEEIAHMHTKGLYILIMIRHIFFDSDQVDGLKEDYMQLWETAKQELSPYMDRVIGFYVDEPIWTGKRQVAFHTACQLVRQDFPDKRMMAMLAYAAVINDPWVTKLSTGLEDIDAKEYCKYCTDIGYDYYRTWDKAKVLEDIALLKQNVITPGQKIWMSPKGFYVSTRTKSINWAFENMEVPIGEEVKRWIKGAYEIAVADHDIVGFFTFVYGNESTGESYDVWLRRFFTESDEYYDIEIKALYTQIGKAIINN